MYYKVKYTFVFLFVQWSVSWQQSLIGALHGHPLSSGGGGDGVKCGEGMVREWERVREEIERTEKEEEREERVTKKRKRGPHKRTKNKKL